VKIEKSFLHTVNMKFQRFFCHTLGVFDVFPITGAAGKVREPAGKTAVFIRFSDCNICNFSHTVLSGFFEAAS